MPSVLTFPNWAPVELTPILMLVQDSRNLHCPPPRVKGDSDSRIDVAWELLSLHAWRGGFSIVMFISVIFLEFGPASAVPPIFPYSSL